MPITHLKQVIETGILSRETVLKLAESGGFRLHTYCMPQALTCRKGIIAPEFTVVDGREAMEMPWASLAELCEAIPPAYTEFIGKRLIEHLQQRRAA